MWVGMISATGAVTGLACAAFLLGLEWAAETRGRYPALILALPVVGLVMGWVYTRWGGAIAGGTDQVIAEANAPTQRIPLRMAPMVLLATLATHVFGGSAGREGTALQMGAALADQWSRWSTQAQRHRQWLLIAGMSAGFAALFGTPWTGAIFALEVLVVGGLMGRLCLAESMLALLAAWIGHGVVMALGIPHPHYAVAAVAPLTFSSAVTIAAAALCFGLFARLFVHVQTFLRKSAEKWVPRLPFRLALGGLFVLGLVAVFGTTRYLGLGIPLIHEGFADQSPYSDSFGKLILTAVTLGFGFKGGEVTPLFAMGATLGSALSGVMQMPTDVFAALGLVAVFAAAANTPIACTIMAMELFGPGIGWHAALACAIAYAVSGYPGIYRTQRLKTQKWLP